MSAVAALRPAFEAAEPDGTTRLEREFVFYGRIVDFDELNRAIGHEEQEQWEIRNPRNDKLQYFGSIRVRKTTSLEPDGGHRVVYVLTMKTMTDDVSGRQEVEIPTTADMFEQIKRLATGGSIKTRYFFPIPETLFRWEVDVYTNRDGEADDWCKIDLEVDSPDYKPPQFPIQLEEVITRQPADRTADERKFVEKLMDEKFILSNAYPKTHTP